MVVKQEPKVRPAATTVGIPDPGAALRDAPDTAAFYTHWIGVLCCEVRKASSGLLLLGTDDGTFRPAAVWPGHVHEVSDLAGSAEQAITTGRDVKRTIKDGLAGATKVHLAHPIIVDGRVAGALVVELAGASAKEIENARRQMAWSIGWPEVMLRRQRPQVRDPVAVRQQHVLDVLAAGDLHERFDPAAVAIANEVACHLGAERVAIGFAGRRGIRFAALSHSIGTDKRSELVRGLEMAMQEAFDQHAAVAYPPIEATARRIHVAHDMYTARWQLTAVLSVILTSAGRPTGVMLVERIKGGAFTQEEFDTAVSMARAFGPTISLKNRQDRLLSGRIMNGLPAALTAITGRDRPSLKLGTAVGAFVLAVLAVWPSEFRVSAKAVLQGQIQRAAVAPFDGFIATAPVRAGDAVRKGQELATLDDRDLKLERLKWETEEQKLIQRQREASAKYERANVVILAAQIEQARSQLQLASERLQRTRILAPIDGVVVSGDLSQSLGGPVAQGKVLFEIAPLSSYRLILHIDEGDIGFVRAGQSGQLLLTGLPAKPLSFKVTRPQSVASVEDGRNIFKVEASVESVDEMLRPGMEGIAKVVVGERSLLSTWARPALDRLKLFVWAWTP